MRRENRRVCRELFADSRQCADFVYTCEMIRPFVSATRRQIHAIPLPPLRLVAILLASIVLHWVLLAWSGFRVGMKLPTLRNEDPVTVALRQAPQTPAPVVPPVDVKPKTAPVVVKPKNIPVKKLKPEKAQPEAGLPPAQASSDTVAAPAAIASEAAANAISAPLAATEPNNEAAPPADDHPALPETPLHEKTVVDAPLDEPPAAIMEPPAQALPARAYRIATPPPADLKYDVQALRDGQNVHGSGRIVWQPAGDRYRIKGEAGVLFFNVLEFHSEGALDDSGVAPAIYSEKRFRKPLTSTQFQREEGLISFSTSALTYPRQGGEQDRASIVWQLAGIGRGDPEAFRPNADITVFVAGARNGETWHVRVIGEVHIEVGAGSMRAWHVVREPRAGSYDQKLDIWFAPEQEWYPVRLLYTERDGDWLEMSLSAVRDIASR